MSEIKVSYGQQVKITDVIGIEGSTGYSTGSHCHYCIRTSMSPGTFLDVCALSGIPNNEGGTYDDGYRPGQQAAAPVKDPAPKLTKDELLAELKALYEKYSI